MRRITEYGYPAGLAIGIAAACLFLCLLPSVEGARPAFPEIFSETAESLQDPAAAPFSPRRMIVPVPEETPGLKSFVVDLNGSWKFNPEPPDEFWANGLDVSAWANIMVPGEWAAQGWTLGQDVERCCRRSVEIPKNFKDRRLIIRFDGVYSYARVWVNGVNVRDHHGGFTSWDCDITPFVTPGETAVITVGVTDRSDEISWGSSYAKHNIGGILQDVRLVALPATHAERFHFGTSLDDTRQKGILEVTAAARLGTAREAELRLSLTDPWDRAVGITPGRILLTAVQPEKTVRISVGNVETWDAEHPRLYRLEARLVSSGKTLEVFRRDVGFREVEVRGRELLVNGRPVKLRGGNRHNVHPVRGRSVTSDLDEKDARLFREANINFVRTSHYPPTEAFLAACDKYGIYVEEENAVCFVATHGNLPSSEDPAFRARYYDQFVEMVERDRSHPSVVIWSMGNESRWGENVRRLHDYVKAEDPSRPVIWSYPDSVPERTAAYDIYSHHYPKFDSDMKSPEIPKLMDEWAHVACYNVETLKRDPGVRDFWGESLMRFWENAYTSEGCLGGAIWGLIDDIFHLPGSSCGYGEWGIIDGWRRPKPEYWHVKKAYSPVRISDRPILDARPGELIRVPVGNWFDHTNLSEIRIRWSIGASSGNIPGPDVPPGGKGEVLIPCRDWRPGDVLGLTFARTDGSVVDEFALPVGESGKRALSLPEGPAPSITADADLIRVAGEDFVVAFDRRTGLIERAESGGLTLLAGGPAPVAAPASFMPWSLTSLGTRVERNEAVLEVRGSYAGTLAEFVIRIDGRGLMTLEYDVKGRPGGASELGIAFDLPQETEAISWSRDGFHSVYPEDHIGRPEGTTRKARAGQADTYRTIPLWPWAEDMSDYFLFGKDHAGYGATRDFRSLRPNIRRVDIGFKGTDATLGIESDGRQAVRAEVLPNGLVRLNVLDHWAYPDLDWGNYEGRPEIPGSLKGRIRIHLKKRGNEMPLTIERKTCTSKDGVTIVYSACGEGEPALVFVHGGMADRTFWKGQLEAFGGNHRTIALDLAGHGESGANRTLWGIPEFGEDVRAVIEAEKLGRTIVIGNSLGGPAALEAAVLLPDRVIGVIGVDTFQDLGGVIGAEEARKRGEAFGADYPGMLKQMLDVLFHKDTDPEFMAWIEGRMSRTSPEVAREMLISFGGYDSGASARRLRIPIRAVNGDLFPTNVEEIRKVKPDFDAVVMPHTGHYPMLEKPDEFNRLLEDILAWLQQLVH